MSNGEPTLGEVLRRLDEVSRQMTDLGRQLVEDRRDAASTYVRRDVYDARHSRLDERITGLEDDAAAKEKSAADTRRQLMVLILSIAIPAVLAFGLAINNFLVNGGATP